MDFNPNEVRPSVFYQHMIHCIVPRPIAWVSTISKNGISNVAPFSYFCGVGSRPPTLLFCPANGRDGGPKDTLKNIHDTKQFVVNIVCESQTAAMNQSAATLPPDESEFAANDLDELPSLKVDPPRVAGAPAHFECELREVIALGDGPGGANIVIGNVVHVHVDDSVIGENGLADPTLLQAVGRMGGLSYVKTQDRFEIPRPE